MHKKEHKVGTNMQISLSPETKGEADHLQKELSKNGGFIECPMMDQIWGSYFGTCTDKFGVQWMIDCAGPSKDGKGAEIKRAAQTLREAASTANEQDEKLEKMTAEPLAKKA